MRVLNLLTLACCLTLAGGTAAAKDKPEAPKGKKVCVVIEPAVGRLPAKRICHVEPPAGAVSADAQREPAKPVDQAKAAEPREAAAGHN